jgi:hypothetical protein
MPIRVLNPPDGPDIFRGLLDRPASDYSAMLEAEVRGDPMPRKPRQEPEPAAPGVFSENLSLHAAVVKQMRELGAPESEYPKVLEKVLRNQASQ